MVKAGEKDNKRGEANPEDVDKSKTSPITEPKVNRAVETKMQLPNQLRKLLSQLRMLKILKMLPMRPLKQLLTAKRTL